MSDILVRDVPEGTLRALKERAARHRRSLQQEVLTIIEEGLAAERPEDPFEVARRIRERLAATGRDFGDSVPLIREDRER